MSDTDYPASVHVLKPRKVSVSKKLDGFLDKAGLTPSQKAIESDHTRPNSKYPNAILCRNCTQVEYLTRDYCRCGHYLRGQLEDEYLAWEETIHSTHAALEQKVAFSTKPLRLFYLLAVPFMLVPAIQLILWFDQFALSALLWWSPAMMLAGAGMFAENHVIRPLKASTQFLETYSFETFLDQRSQGSTNGM